MKRFVRNAGVPPAVPAASRRRVLSSVRAVRAASSARDMRHDNFIPPPQLVAIHSRGRLPHWNVQSAIYFVTFRLRDSLPREIIAALMLERKHLERSTKTPAERAHLGRAFGTRLDAHLDEGHGSCCLREHAEIVATALLHFDGERYDLHAWCVMPNHVHVMLSLQDNESLPKVVHSWKSFTAHAIGRGVIWQREYFDRVVRSAAEFAETRAYIHRNPEHAGLRDWPWVG